MLHEPHSFLIYVNIDGSWYKACCESKTKSSIQVKFILFDCIFYKCEGVMIYVLISLQPGRYRVEGIKENVSNPIAQSRYEGYFFQLYHQLPALYLSSSFITKFIFNLNNQCITQFLIKQHIYQQQIDGLPPGIGLKNVKGGGQKVWVIKFTIDQELTQAIKYIYNYKKQMIFAQVLVLTLIAITHSAFSQTINGIILTSQRVDKNDSIDISTVNTGDRINIHFEVINSNNITATFMITSFDGNYEQNDIDKTKFYGKNPKRFDNVDLDAMWSYQQQYINLVKQSGKNQLYITVFNFDSAINQDIEYRITIQDDDDSVCGPCANNQDYGTQCYCQDCRDGAFGKRCQRQAQILTQSTDIILQAHQMKYFNVQEPGSYRITLEISSGLGQAYFQYVTFDEEVASFYNVALSDKGTPAIFTLKAGKQSMINGDINQTPLSMSIVNFNDDPVLLRIKINISENSNILVIILGILGGILLVGLIIAAVCIVRRSQNSRVSIQGQQLPTSSKLSGDEIQRFFPAAYLREIVGSPDNEMTMENFEKKKPEESDCVICLQKIELENVVRMGYCKHMFHSTCLITWLKKQRNCPYCRRDFNRDTTSVDYQRLMNENGKRVLRNLDLLKAIHKSSPAVIAEQ